MNNKVQEKQPTNIELLKLSDCEWSFSQEREFIENLFVGRFNTFMIVFSLFFLQGFVLLWWEADLLFFIPEHLYCFYFG